MPCVQNNPRRDCVPIIYTRGTHYEVGFDVGKTFAAVIHDFLENCWILNDVFLPRYNTSEGRKIYDETLAACVENFPQYVREIEGTADGAKVPFHKLFLLHVDDINTAGMDDKDIVPRAINCSSVCLNQPQNEVLGHTEDALVVTLNRFYYVSAHIISDKPEGKWGVKEERFTSLCYAGHLPGYTMGYNHHGLIFTINTLAVKNTLPGKIPRHFITRALLSAENFEQAQKIIRDKGCGAGNGCSINMTFLNQPGCRLFHNAEMAPAYESNESELNILTVSSGELSVHCNSYLRLKIDQGDEAMLASSAERLRVLTSVKPKTRDDVVNMLGDTSSPTFRVFEDVSSYVNTIAVGIFDLVKRTYCIYVHNPSKTKPVVVLPLDFPTC